MFGSIFGFLSADIGNGFTKVAASSLELTVFPSHIAEIASAAESCKDLGDAGSVIEYVEGDRKELVGRTFAVGTAAFNSSVQRFAADSAGRYSRT